MEKQIIGISGKSGAGKSTLAKALSDALNATCISWDDFDEISTGPEDYIDWFERGGNYAEWNYSALAHVLDALKNGQTIKHPVSNVLLKPTKYIIFDAPLSRLHCQTGCYIDLAIHLQVPLDVLLARRLLRDFKTAERSKEELCAELENYLDYSRKLFFDDNLESCADLVLDGLSSIQSNVNTIKSHLKINDKT